MRLLQHYFGFQKEKSCTTLIKQHDFVFGGQQIRIVYKAEAKPRKIYGSFIYNQQARFMHAIISIELWKNGRCLRLGQFPKESGQIIQQSDKFSARLHNSLIHLNTCERFDRQFALQIMSRVPIATKEVYQQADIQTIDPWQRSAPQFTKCISNTFNGFLTEYLKDSNVQGLNPLITEKIAAAELEARILLSKWMSRLYIISTPIEWKDPLPKTTASKSTFIRDIYRDQVPIAHLS